MLPREKQLACRQPRRARAAALCLQPSGTLGPTDLPLSISAWWPLTCFSWTVNKSPYHHPWPPARASPSPKCRMKLKHMVAAAPTHCMWLDNTTGGSVGDTSGTSLSCVPVQALGTS